MKKKLETDFQKWIKKTSEGRAVLEETISFLKDQHTVLDIAVYVTEAMMKAYHAGERNATVNREVRDD